MSSIARWSYKNIAVVRPFESMNEWKGEPIYGTPYTIDCNWTAEAKMERESGGVGGARGAEFVSQNIIFAEDPRPKYMDLIQLGGVGEFQQIRSVTGWDMEMFQDSMDYKLVT